MPKKPKQIQTTIDDPSQKTNPKELGYKSLSTDLIDDPEQPMRSDLNEANCESLVLSIKKMGVIEPLIVRPVKGRYEVIAGHRRLYSAKLAKVPLVPCIIREANTEQTEMLKIHENLYREDIKPADEAKHFDYLIQKQKMTPEKIANLISKSAGYVSDRLAILNYPPVLRDALDKQEISFSVAREFARFDDEKKMRDAVYYAQRSGMTHSLARKWVKDYYDQKNNPYGQPTTPSADTEPAQPVEHSVTCAYCRAGMRMIEAQVVYMHQVCLDAANAVELQHQPKDEPQG